VDNIIPLDMLVKLLTKKLLFVKLSLMRLDEKLTAILSDFFLDIAKAFFVATFITPALGKASSLSQVLWILTSGLTNVILFLALSWYLAKLGEKL